MADQGKRGAKRTPPPTALWIAIILVAVAVLIWAFAGRDTTPKKVVNAEQEVVTQDDVLQVPSGELTFPGFWTDKVTHETVENGEDLQIVFRSALKDAQIELFRLCYGTASEEGFLIGKMADGTAVSVVMRSIEPDDVWSKETLDTLYALQESVNDLLVQLQTDPDIVPQG